MTGKYKATIGLEIHAQLSTKTKLFSASLNDPNANTPNSIVSPVDAAHPGTLPALNKEAVKKVIEVGLSIDGNIADYTEWDRKNYFYPDIPKAYQISQYKYPLVTGGSIAGFELTRIHLEEDTGKSIHDQGEYSLVDLNRAGMPLMELVTEPVLHTAKDAVAFAKELQLLLRYLGAGEANLEKGEMRIEANISVSDTNELGTKVEVKNLNSFRSVESAIDYEIARHIKCLEEGVEITQETRGWNEDNKTTFTQRKKEDAHDYRYFPDPDLPKLFISEVFDLEVLKQGLPLTPAQTKRALDKDGLNDQYVTILIENPKLYSLYQEVAKLVKSDLENLAANKIASIIISNYLGLLKSDEEGTLDNITANNLADLIILFNQEEISSSAVDVVLISLYQKPGEVGEIIKDLGLKQDSDLDSVNQVAAEIIAENSEVVEEYKSGKDNALSYLVGQGMKKTKGQINPKLLSEVIQAQIN